MSFAPPQTRLFLITGISGSGRTSVIKHLEDVGVEAVDNLPLGLVAPFTEAANRQADVAVALDTRTRGFSADALQETLAELKTLVRNNKVHHIPVLIYLDCEDSVILRRFTETRRRHPLSCHYPLPDAIQKERSVLEKLRLIADDIIDTTDLHPRDLRRIVGERYTEAAATMAVVVESFAFRHGLPRAADLVFDVRFLKNPYYSPALCHKTGQDPDVAAYILQDPQTSGFLSRLGDMLMFLLPLYCDEGKTHLTIAIGCTGGQHRSVFICDRLVQVLSDAGYPVTVKHRELNHITHKTPSSVRGGTQPCIHLPVNQLENE